MITYTVKLSESLLYFGKKGSRVRFTGFGPRVAQMTALGRAAIRSIRLRLADGIGSSDQPMPPLSKGYDGWKVSIGLQEIRDLWGPGMNAKVTRTSQLTVGARKRSIKYDVTKLRRRGSMHMLDDLRITNVSETTCKIDITTLLSRLKAQRNEKTAPWAGLSPRDLQNVNAEAAKIFTENINSVAARFSISGNGGSQFRPRMAA